MFEQQSLINLLIPIENNFIKDITYHLDLKYITTQNRYVLHGIHKHDAQMV